jgi:hypothetical protein
VSTDRPAPELEPARGFVSTSSAATAWRFRQQAALEEARAPRRQRAKKGHRRGKRVPRGMV